MCTFYIDQYCGDNLIVDDEGQDFTTIEEAKQQATIGAREIMSAEVATGHLRLDQRFELRDAAGRQVAVIPFGQVLRITAVQLAAAV